MSKFYCVYLAYAKWEVMDRNDEDYDNLPDYPKDFARVRIYDNQLSQLECYANTPCPASQIFEADTKEEINKKVEELKNNFINEAWLDKNIRPFL